MIREIIESIIEALETAGIHATGDSRNIKAPGCFVTVTRLARPTLAGSWRITAEILAIGRDLGGLDDIDQISALVDDVVDVLADLGAAEIDSIDTNQQATPPTGGTLPAARLVFTLYVDRT